MAKEYAALKLGGLNLGIGPFVVGPAVERKIGLSAMSQIAIDANSFYDARWAQEKGLYTHLFDDTQLLDDAVVQLAQKLKAYNPEAMAKMKAMFWGQTEQWDELLQARAAISGALVLSSFTKDVLKNY